MKKIKNPFLSREDYQCFGCSPKNHLGLQMKFSDEGEYVVCEWEPRPEFQGYNNVLHGGIQATLMDEIASWTIYVKAGTGGVTSRMETKYKRPVYTDRGTLTLKAKIKHTVRRIVTVEVQLFDHDSRLCSFGEVDYFTMSEEEAIKKLLYPGKEAFR
ncbi:MAG TPA: PaaI family thioesterase [Bacteroidales bacterium]|nr:PaaI family thioesterase [Bacteroidales bacterium]